ncbi:MULTISPECIES: PASTA domain-containing protein [Flavobacterium]|uniref:PASTA domain protein n=2 Tax=Flavobacterium TaxID=237 RepID=A0A437UA18_9FLAO|nr:MULTISPECIES: PASTA domain-containing protein [Flavobacterium]OWP83680.1 PASTA domain-containing protein [Flavobacterium davisii]RVU90447.1 PASTA domain-containing protein [Flavobacterium columnare]SPE78094.1 PASTA domain protein [Flavobacterium columnare]
MNWKRFILSFTFFKQLFFAFLIVSASLFIFMQWISFTTNHGQEITVPNLSKLTLEEAEEKLDELDLDYELLDTTDYNPAFPKLSIVQQDPKPGSKVKQNRVIYVKINAEEYAKVRLPDLIQKTYRQAVPTLNALGLSVGDTTYVPNLAKDMVLEMNINGKPIRPGQQVLKMTRINLVLGDGKIGFEEEDTDLEDQPVDSTITK